MREVIKEQFARQAFRTLLIAYKDLTMTEFENLRAQNNQFKDEKDREVLENLGLTVIGIYGLQDPLRPEIV
jgi:magnesium-transporting ATPase (P-type)